MSSEPIRKGQLCDRRTVALQYKTLNITTTLESQVSNERTFFSLASDKSSDVTHIWFERFDHRELRLRLGFSTPATLGRLLQARAVIISAIRRVMIYLILQL